MKLNRRRKIAFGLGTLLLLLIVGAVVIVNVLNSPAVGTITSASNAKFTMPLAEPKKPGTYSGKYISFTYPTTFSVNPSQKSPGLLDQVHLYSNDHSGKQVAIAVYRGTLANDSGVNYRKVHSELYKQTTDSKGDLVFIKSKNGSEYTSFLDHNDLVASVSLTSTYTKDLSADYQFIIKSFQWK